MGLACPPEPILSLGGVACLGVAVEGRHMASVGESEGSDGFLVSHFYDWFMIGKLVLFWPSALAGFRPHFAGLTSKAGISLKAGFDLTNHEVVSDLRFEADVILDPHLGGRRVHRTHNGRETTVVFIEGADDDFGIHFVWLVHL